MPGTGKLQEGIKIGHQHQVGRKPTAGGKEIDDEARKDTKQLPFGEVSAFPSGLTSSTPFLDYYVSFERLKISKIMVSSICEDGDSGRIYHYTDQVSFWFPQP